MGPTASAAHAPPGGGVTGETVQHLTPAQVLANWDELEQRYPAFIHDFVVRLTAADRPAYWRLMADPSRFTSKNPQLYLHLLNEANKQLAQQEPAFLALANKIDLDVARTFPQDSGFTDAHKRQLRNVLSAFAVLLPNIGYCQGMSFLAGKLLQVLQNEEECLWVFCHFMKTMNLYGLYSDGLPLLRFAVFCVERTAGKEVPAVAAYLRDADASMLLVVGQWLSALFTISFPDEVTLKIWDVYLLEGFVWIVKVCVALLSLHRALFKGLIDTAILNLRTATASLSWPVLFAAANTVIFSSRELKALQEQFV